MKSGHKQAKPADNNGKCNSFNFLRLLGAILVVYSHSFALTGHIEPHFGDSTVSLGKLGVWIFFIISGYLISMSWDQYPRFNVFMAKRGLRIFPALIVVTIVTIIISAFLTELPIKKYLTDPGTHNYLNNVFLYNMQGALPGVFIHNVYSTIVNGSLWTLAYEFTLYIVVALIGVFHMYRKISPFLMWCLLFILNLTISVAPQLTPNFNLFYLNLGAFLPLALMYFSGILFYKNPRLLTPNLFIGGVAFVCFVFLTVLLPAYAPLFGATLLAYAIFCIGAHPFMSWVQRYGDISYGVYIYSFFIQQIIVHYTHTQSPRKMFAASLAISCLCGIISWYLVEKPALNLKNRINIKRYPLATDDAW